MEQKQIEVLQWWYGTRDYATGTMLYGKYGKNAVLKNTFNKPGKEKVMSGKLHYELCKSVGLDWNNMPQFPDEIEMTSPLQGGISKVVMANASGVTPLPGNKLPAAPYDPQKYVPIISDLKLMQYPKVIRRLKMEYQENYQQRSILHKNLVAIGEENSPQQIADRAVLLKQIHEKSARMEYLYKFIENYEKNSVVPLEEEVWPPEEKNELPNDIDELKKLKKNLQTNNTKDNNLLVYQQKTKTDKENPMPAGPKRTRIELRIKRKESEIVAIDNKIVELENAT